MQNKITPALSMVTSPQPLDIHINSSGGCRSTSCEAGALMSRTNIRIFWQTNPDGDTEQIWHCVPAVSSPPLYNYPPTTAAVKQLSESRDYQLTIIWAGRLSHDNYLSSGLSLKIPRRNPHCLFLNILKPETFELTIHKPACLIIRYFFLDLILIFKSIPQTQQKYQKILRRQCCLADC